VQVNFLKNRTANNSDIVTSSHSWVKHVSSLQPSNKVGARRR